MLFRSEMAKLVVPEIAPHVVPHRIIRGRKEELTVRAFWKEAEPWFPAWPPSVGSHDVLDSVGLNADQPLLHTQQRGLPFLHAGHTACLWEGDRGNGWPLRKCAHTHGKMQILKLGNSSTLRAQRQSGRSKLEGLGAESGGAITGVIEDRLCLI